MPASGFWQGAITTCRHPLQGLYPGEYEVVLYPHSFATAGTGEAQAVSVFRIADFTLIVGGSLGLRDQLRRRLSLVFAVVFLPTAILLGLLSGRITPRLSLARLDKIAETARQVGAGQFATRIALTQANDEFDRLSATPQPDVRAQRSFVVCLAYDYGFFGTRFAHPFDPLPMPA